MDYGTVWDLQQRLVQARKEQLLSQDLVIVLEHHPVFTLGRRGGKEYLTVSEGFVAKNGVTLFRIERGGTITYHGPGQLIAYPIVDLGKARLSVTDYVACLEEVMICLSAEWGVKAVQNNKNRGVWVGEKKLGSLGIAVRRGICFHGFALNVDIAMEPFSWLHPCGLEGVEMTSLAFEIGRRIDMASVRRSVRSHIESVFHVDLKETSLSSMKRLLRMETGSENWKAVS